MTLANSDESDSFNVDKAEKLKKKQLKLNDYDRKVIKWRKMVGCVLKNYIKLVTNVLFVSAKAKRDDEDV